MSDQCEWCAKTSSQIDSLEYQMETMVDVEDLKKVVQAYYDGAKLDSVINRIKELIKEN